MGRYFLDVENNIPNAKKQINRVIAFGQQAVYGDLAKFGDADNAWGLVEFANGKILQVTLSRTITNGFEAAASAKCPALFVLGARDLMTRPSAAAGLVERLPGSRVVKVPEAGHALMAERPDAVLDALRGFLPSPG